jgi:hypothetical protein
MPDARDGEDIDLLKPDDGKNVGKYIARQRWERIKKEGKRIKHFYVELSVVKDTSIS